MCRNEYRYVLSLFKKGGGQALGHFSIEPDFEPAGEWARFTGQRRGELPLALPDSTATSVEPRWNGQGEPYAEGFEVRVQAGARQTGCEFGLAYFSDLAHAASKNYVDSGDLKAGDTFCFLVSAYRRDPEQRAEAGPAVAVKSLIPPLVVKGGAELSGYMRVSVPSGNEDDRDGVDPHVFIPQHVFDEACELTRSAGSNETGGILIGHIRGRAGPDDRGGKGDLFVEITAQVPASYVESTVTRLTFTQHTWSAAQAAVSLRKQGELFCGWWHSHSFLKETCRNCVKREQNICKTNAAFLSAEDRALHRTVFPRSYSIALVISDSPCSGLIWRLFGWRLGRLEPRNFRILGGHAAGNEKRGGGAEKRRQEVQYA